MFYSRLSIFLFFTLMACQNQNHEKISTSNHFSQKVIYGADNRIDFFDIHNPEWLNLAQSTVAIVDHLKLTDEGNHYKLESTIYGVTYGLCSEEPFFNQPISAFCSGALIAPDIVLTAGHCIRKDPTSCQRARFVFGYNYSHPGDDPTEISKDDVYSCKEVIHTELNNLTGVDFALIRLDRQVINYSPLPMRHNDSIINKGEPLAVVGYPAGMPGKFASGGSVRHHESKTIRFVADIDTYGGNSGGPVFNLKTKWIEGIIVSGETDYEYDRDAGCRRSKICKQTECSGEKIVPVSVVLEYLNSNELSQQPLQTPKQGKDYKQACVNSMGMLLGACKVD